MGRILLNLVIASIIFQVSLSINPPTSVMDLNEKFVDVMDEGMWFVEFYAPWCAHCKRLHPIWDQVGHALADSNLPIRVGKMDCTRFSSVASVLGINGYPTVIFFRNGKRIDYRGSREKEALVSFAKRCAAPVIEPIKEARLQKLRLDSRTEPSFVYYGQAKGEVYDLFSNAANEMFSVARFYSIAQDASSSQNYKEKITVVKDNTEIEYNAESDGELEKWMSRERWPAFVAASSANLGEIGSSGKLVVIVVSSQVDKYNSTSPVHQFHKVAEETVKKVKNDRKLWNRYQFAWLDGSDLASQIQMKSVKEPHLFVFNYTSYEYYLSEDEPEKMTPKSIITFLQELADSVDKGTVVAFGGRHLLTRVKRMAFELYWNIAQMFATQPLLSSCLFGVPIAFLSIICYSICSADFSVDRDEFYPDEDEDPLLDEETENEGESDHEKAD